MGSRLDLRGIAPRTYATMARLSDGRRTGSGSSRCWSSS